jgi:hypothetical protein
VHTFSICINLNLKKFEIAFDVKLLRVFSFLEMQKLKVGKTMETLGTPKYSQVYLKFKLRI